MSVRTRAERLLEALFTPKSEEFVPPLDNGRTLITRTATNPDKFQHLLDGHEKRKQADADAERRKKRNEDQRRRRAEAKASRAAQRKRTKELLETPLAVWKAEVAAKLKAEKEIGKLRDPSYAMHKGEAMRGGPGEPRLRSATGGYDSRAIDFITGLEVAEDHLLGRGLLASDELNVETRGSRSRTGALPSADSFSNGNEEGQSFSFSSEDKSYDMERAVAAALSKLFPRYFSLVDLERCDDCSAVLDKNRSEHTRDYDGEAYECEGRLRKCAGCRLCGVLVTSEREGQQHIYESHGDPAGENHDSRFGDIVTPAAKKVLAAYRKWEKQGRLQTKLLKINDAAIPSL